MASAIITRIGDLFTERLARDVPAVDVDLFEAGVLDSLSFADLLVGLEDEFGIRIAVDELDIDRFRTLGTLEDLVTSAMTASVAAIGRGA